MAPRGWWPFLGLIFLAGVLFRVFPLAAFAGMLLVISAIAQWWNKHALDKVHFQRRLIYQRGFLGETLDLRVEVENYKFLPLTWLRVKDIIPYSVGPADDQLLKHTHIPELGSLETLFSLRWFERDKRDFVLQLRKRGIFRLGPARLESGDIFGMFESEDENNENSYLTVFPKPLPLKAINIPIGDPFGHQRTRRRLYQDPNQTIGVRLYHPEDGFRDIHWPVTAHTGELHVKVYQPISARVIIVCLNVTTTLHHWEGSIPDLLEHLVRVAATLVEESLHDGYQVGLISNGCFSHADQPNRVPPGRSREQLARLLTALAGVTPFITAPFDRFLITQVPRLPYGASLVVLTGLLNDSLVETLLRLKQHGRRITLLSFENKVPPDLPGVRIYHLPFYGTPERANNG